MDFVHLGKNAARPAIIARLLSFKPFVGNSPVLHHPVDSFHTMHIYVTLRRYIYRSDAAKLQDIKND